MNGMAIAEADYIIAYCLFSPIFQLNFEWNQLEGRSVNPKNEGDCFDFEYCNRKLA